MLSRVLLRECEMGQCEMIDAQDHEASGEVEDDRDLAMMMMLQNAE